MGMRLRSIYLLVALVLISVLALGCSGAKESAVVDTGDQQERADEAVKEMPTKENPMAVDKENGEIRLYTEVNAKYFVEPTRHGVIMQGGTYGDKPILTAFTKPADFYNALMDIGAKPGNNVKLDSPPGTIVKGNVIKVTVDVDDKTYDFSEIVKGEPELGWEPRFGGNLDNSEIKKTGCLLCLDSCAVGIVSNSKYGTKSFDGGTAKFYGREEILKEDKKPVVVTFKVETQVIKGHKSGDYKYVKAEELKEILENESPVHLLDIQVEEEFNKGHIKGSIATYAYPTKTDEERAKLDPALPKLKEDNLQIVIVCPRGGGGAERAVKHMKENGISEDRIFILEKGWEGWPYPEFIAQANN